MGFGLIGTVGSNSGNRSRRELFRLGAGFVNDDNYHALITLAGMHPRQGRRRIECTSIRHVDRLEAMMDKFGNERALGTPEARKGN